MKTNTTTSTKTFITRTDGKSICSDCRFLPIFGPICHVARKTVPASACAEYVKTNGKHELLRDDDNG